MSKKYYVYRFLDKNNNVIYVGRTNSIITRMNQHFDTDGHLPTEWYEQVEHIEYIKMSSIIDMYIKELYYINRLKPIYNRNDININDEKYFDKVDEELDIWIDENIDMAKLKTKLEYRKKCETIYNARMQKQIDEALSKHNCMLI